MSTYADGTSLAAIGARLELTRRVFGLTQLAFCTRAGIASNTYNNYERGHKRPAIENAIALCDTYDVTLDWIYRGEMAGLPHGLATAIRALMAAEVA